ncbi:nucleoside transporter [Teratosphaeria destructans]|uniref:Nucleoside transporter n=1 Tax=Teratosphaeria destructans TaxID=418781 RepID=A0A9W7SKC4_9PEZI|nr:nucleoside transporter [Teratosphaeria destructans]
MDRLRRLFKQEPAYQPLEDGMTENDSSLPSTAPPSPHKRPTFSYIEYSIFLLLGVSMLWAWNMFLAAGPYFQHRFRTNDWISNNFQAAEISVSTITNLGSMLILTRLQKGASYPKRIVTSLVMNMAVFGLLALFTEVFLSISARGYFGFLMVMIFATSLATGLCQNGIFAYVSGFGEPRYTQGIMTGQAIAGVLPCIAQIVSVLGVQGGGKAEDRPHQPPGEDGPPPRGPPPVNPGSAFAYFLTATVISVATLIAFFYLLARNRRPQELQDANPDTTDEPEERKSIPLIVLFRKLFWLASAVFITFGVTMVFPVFTQRIVSVRPHDQQPPLLQPPSFIPLAFLFWNAGDLIGRLITAVPSLSLIHRPRLIFLLAVLRIAFVGLYHLCNIRGKGAIVASDVFYLVVVQLLFGLTSGYLGSTCMIGAGEWVEPEEREAAGGFMGLCLVAGLTIGSLASFFVAGG